VRLAALALWVVMALIAVLPALRGRSAHDARRRVSSEELVKDPVCETYVVRSRAVTRHTAAGPRYFCSTECAGRFTG
jgi:YHS domain-containing protein